MGATIVVKERTKFAGLFAVIADVTFDNSYPTGGEALTANQFGLNTMSFVLPSPSAGYIFEFNHTAKKLKAFTPTAVSVIADVGVADANNTLMKSAAGSIEVAGTGTAFAVNNAATEVANTTNLSTVTVRVLAIGY